MRTEGGGKTLTPYQFLLKRLYKESCRAVGSKKEKKKKKRRHGEKHLGNSWRVAGKRGGEKKKKTPIENCCVTVCIFRTISQISKGTRKRRGGRRGRGGGASWGRTHSGTKKNLPVKRENSKRPAKGKMQLARIS